MSNILKLSQRQTNAYIRNRNIVGKDREARKLLCIQKTYSVQRTNILQTFLSG